MVQVYTHDDVLSATKDYFAGDELAANVWVTKYALKNNKGEFVEKTPDDMHIRLAKEFGRIEKNFGGKNVLSVDEIYSYLRGFDSIVPQGSPMHGIGNNYKMLSLSNCFVIASPEDSISGIFDTARDMANLYKRRGGVGVDISTLRPDGMSVNNSSNTSTGAWSFADFYSYVCRMVGQCIAKNEEVLTDNGLKFIQDICIGDKVWTKEGFVKVINTLSNGKKKIYKITDKFGYTIRASEDHIFISENNGVLIEKRLKDFELGDSIVLIPGTAETNIKNEVLLQKPVYEKSVYNNSNRLNEDIVFPTNLSSDLAYILGYSYGDGCVSFDKYSEPKYLELACSNSWQGIKNKLTLFIKKCFNYNVSIRSGDGDLERFTIGSKLILKFLEHNNILKQKSGELIFPEKIKNSPINVQASFLAGYFDADGYASGSKKGYVFSSICKNFIDEVKKVLISIGVVTDSHVEYRENKGWNDLYSINVVGTLFQKRFLSLISSSVKVLNSGHISKVDNHLTPYKANTFGIKTNKYNFVPGNGQYLSSNCYERLLNLGEKDIPNNILIKSSVKSIEKDGVEDTFDLCLAKEHLYFCQGFQVHNSGRRGATILTMDVRHPDIIKFVTMKHDLTKVTGANISVKITDDFMRAVESDSDFVLRYPVDSVRPTFSTTIRAKDLWATLVASATKTAEPGLLMWDTILRNLPANCYEEYKTICVNPCGEINLSANDSCRLISLNLKNLVNNPFSTSCSFDNKKWAKTVRVAQRLSDDLVELEIEKLNVILKKVKDKREINLWSKIKRAAERGRRTGLGTHGLADSLSRMCLRYDSDEAIKFAGSTIYRTLRNEAYKESIELAKERGPFPVFDWETEKDNEFIKRLPKSVREGIKEHGRRNISLLTNAPTGSVAIESKTSSGIEPMFQVSYTRRRKLSPTEEGDDIDFVDASGDKWSEYEVLHHNIQEYLDIVGTNAKTPLPDYFISSGDVNPGKRIDMQAAIQKNIDHSLSNTVNLPKGTSSTVVGSLYFDAWKKGLKGVTVYVDESRSGVLVNKKKEKEDIFPSNNAAKRPIKLDCEIHQPTIKGERWVVIVGLLDDGKDNMKPYEVFAGKANRIEIPKKYVEGYIVKSARKTTRSIYDLEVGEGDDKLVIKDIVDTFDDSTNAAFTRTISLSLRHGCPIKYIVEQLQKDKDSDMFSFSKVVARVLKKYIKNGEKVSGDKVCPSCDTEGLVYSDGCRLCTLCGWSACS
jgi:ribonucleoside-diphosphate reductase alpha chain